MLVLSRKLGEEIVIGDNIRVRILSIQGNQVRLGFEAPRSVAIQRQELLVGVLSETELRPERKARESEPTPTVVAATRPASAGA